MKLKPARKNQGTYPSDHAIAALKALLAQVSAIKLKEVRLECCAPSREFLVVAYVDVYGHGHTLVCAVKECGEPDSVRDALKELRGRATEISGNATPVLIAPRLSVQAQLLCTESHAGFLDLEGNARLNLDDFFIGQRSLPPELNRSVLSEDAASEFEGAA